MKSFDTRTYAISDFVEWQANKLLTLSPQFQRRAVWTTKAKSYLIDTVLRGKPMPKVLITQRLEDGKTARTVVDGQQRLRAILEYLRDDFPVMRTHNKEHAGLRYSQLPPDIQDQFLQYEVGVDVLFNTELSELLDIFSRLNTYSVRLNKTELLNAKYLGAFKTAAHNLGHAYAAYWRDGGVLTDAKIARMAEVELSADVLGALIQGITSRKQIENFYRLYDEADDLVEEATSRFHRAMQLIGEIYEPADLRRSNFSRVHLFYSVLLALAGILDGKPDVGGTAAEGQIDPGRARVILDDVSARFDAITNGGAPSTPEWDQFIEASRRATTDQSVREERTRFLVKALMEG